MSKQKINATHAKELILFLSCKQHPVLNMPHKNIYDSESDKICFIQAVEKLVNIQRKG